MFQRIQNLAILALASVSFAQNLSSLSDTLNTEGLTCFLNLTETLVSSSSGAALVEALSNGTYTILALSNDACASVTTTNETLLGEVLSYHILEGRFDDSSSPVNFTSATSPNHTIGHTLLNGSDDGFPEALAWTQENGGISFLNQPNNANISVTKCIAVNGTTIDLCVINGVLTIPGTTSSAIAASNNTQSLNGLIDNISVLSPNGTTNETLGQFLDGQQGCTIFAPDDTAVSAVSSALPALESNGSTTLVTLILNHILNGTTLYSTQITNGLNLTTAAGESITFTTNSTGIFVKVGNTTAQIIQSDIITSNCVLHIINNIFVDTNSNPSAASSAYASATSAAAQQTAETGAITATTTGSSGGSSTSTSSSTSNGAEALPVVSRSYMTALATVVSFVVFGAYLV